MIVHNKLCRWQSKSCSRFELHTFSIQIPLGFWIVGAVKVVNNYKRCFNGIDNPKPKWNLDGESVCFKTWAAFTSSPPTEFVMYDHSKPTMLSPRHLTDGTKSLGGGTYSSEVYCIIYVLALDVHTYAMLYVLALNIHTHCTSYVLALNQKKTKNST